MKRLEIRQACKGLFGKLRLCYTHYHLLVVLNIVLVSLFIVAPIFKTNAEYKYGRLPCDPVFTSLILNGKKYDELQKFKIRLSSSGFAFEYLMVGSYYLSAMLSLIAHLFRSKAFCFLHHVAVGFTCLFGLCFAYVAEMFVVWAKGMVTGLSGLRSIKVECYKPYQALDMHEYVKDGLVMVAVVALWDVLVTRRYEKKYLNTPLSVNLPKCCKYSPKFLQRIFKSSNVTQSKEIGDPVEMI